jgi:predicted NBD/HSP70 family sugar kinase
MEKATQRLTKEHNRDLVIRMIFEHDSISRADIARKTHLTRTTVSEIVSELIEEGFVSEIGVRTSSVGKNPVLLSLIEDSRCIIGIDLAQNQFTGALLNLRGKIYKTISLPINEYKGEEALSLVYDIIDQLVSFVDRPLLGIGVGTIGLVDVREGVVINAVNLGWQNLPLTSLLRDRYHKPVSVLNDSQAAAIGEYTYGKKHPADDDLVVINARHGIGSGIVVHGNLYQGQGGSAGEIGHIVVVPIGGIPCRCGNRGCLETVASVHALINRARSLVSQFPNTKIPHEPQNITLNAIDFAFKSGDTLANQLVLEAGRYIGLAVAYMVGILNIQKVVLTGDMTCFGTSWLESIIESMHQFSLSTMSQNTQIELGQLGENGIIMGASAILINNYSLLFTDRS